MDNSALSAELGALARADDVDIHIITEIQHRIIARQHQRNKLLGSTSEGDEETLKPPLLEPKDVFLYVKQEIMARVDGHKLFTCPACGGRPDDPRLTACAHFYCEECYSELLVDAGSEADGDDGYVLCEAHECSENILENMVLDENQLDLLANIFYTQMKKREEVSGKRRKPVSVAGNCSELSSAAVMQELTTQDDDPTNSTNIGEKVEVSDDSFEHTSQRSLGYESETDIEEPESVSDHPSEAEDISVSGVDSEVVSPRELADILDDMQEDGEALSSLSEGSDMSEEERLGMIWFRH